MKTTAKQTARETYETRQREIVAMLDFLKCELEGHADTRVKRESQPQAGATGGSGNAKADGLHWGHVGDLGHIRENLKETLVFVMGGRDEEATGNMIESAIADALA